MGNLIDTHTFIWFVEGDSRLSAEARKAIEEEDAINFVSIATLWEIAIKLSLKKLELQGPFSKISDQIFENGFKLLPITFDDALILTTLPFFHRDPFDRIIISQGINNKLVILSKDAVFSEYPVQVVW